MGELEKGAWRVDHDVWSVLKPLAREQRKQPTAAEARLWEALRGSKLGVRFRRQHAIDRFLVDFFCSSARLVIEVDGPIHGSTKEDDKLRQDVLESLGLEVLRLDYAEVLENLEAVLARISSVLVMQVASAPSPSPSTERGNEGVRLP